MDWVKFNRHSHRAQFFLNFLEKGKRYCTMTKTLFHEFTKEETQKYLYKVVGIETKKNKKNLIVQLAGRRIKRKTPGEIILDDAMLNGPSPKAVRAMTDLAVLEQLAPEFKLAGLEFNQEKQEYVVTLKHQSNTILEKQSASFISKNINLVKKLSSEDANRIGYMAGLNDAARENHVKQSTA